MKATFVQLALISDALLCGLGSLPTLRSCTQNCVGYINSEGILIVSVWFNVQLQMGTSFLAAAGKAFLYLDTLNRLIFRIPKQCGCG